MIVMWPVPVLIWLLANTVGNVPGKIRFKLLIVPEVKGGRLEIRQGTIYVDGADEVVLWGSVATSFKATGTGHGF